MLLVIEKWLELLSLSNISFGNVVKVFITSGLGLIETLKLRAPKTN